MKKILIVDDDEGMRHSIKRLLSLERKYDIEEASDGIAAEKKAEEFVPDLIILDIKMPGKDGYEVCFNLRKKIGNEKMKVVAMSGFSGKFGEAIMEALGADCYFEKPFDSEVFKKRIAALLGET